MARYDPRSPVPIKGGENQRINSSHKTLFANCVTCGCAVEDGAAAATQPACRAAVLVQSPHGGPIPAAAKG